MFFTHNYNVLTFLSLYQMIKKCATKKLEEKNKQVRLASAKKTIEKLEGGKNIY
ncbi:MAG: hypothetical protein WAU24_01020 [Chitinophagaceae bacterium]